MSTPRVRRLFVRAAALLAGFALAGEADAGSVSGEYLGNGREAKLASVVALPHDDWSGEKAWTIVVSEKDASKAKVTCAVSIGPRDGGGFGLAVKMRVEDKSLKQAELEALAREAHEKICPYSHATRGNVNVQLEVVGG